MAGSEPAFRPVGEMFRLIDNQRSAYSRAKGSGMTRSESDALDRLTARLGASDWPLGGRDVELAAADRAMAQGRAGVVFAGQSGVGRTRVAREALQRAAGRGRETTWLTATAASSQVPLGIVAHLTGGIAGTRSP